MAEQRIVRRHHRQLTLAATAMLVTTALASSATTATATTAATTVTLPPGTTVTVKAPAQLIDMSQPRNSGSIWVLHGNKTKKTLSQLNLIGQVAVGSESVSPDADSLALSAGGVTLAIGTNGGAYPAVVWYNSITGDYVSSARASQPVTQVAVDADGSAITSLRGPAGHQMVAVTGTSNGHSFHYPVVDHPVDVAVSPDGSQILVLHADGTVTAVAFPVGTPSTVADVGAPAQTMVLSPNGKMLYVLLKPAHKGASTTTVDFVSLKTGAVEGSFPVSSNCVALTVSPDGKTLLEGLSGRYASSIKLVILPPV